MVDQTRVTDRSNIGLEALSEKQMAVEFVTLVLSRTSGFLFELLMDFESCPISTSRLLLSF